MRLTAAAVLIAASCTPGIGPLLYHYAPQTREYEFERIVPVAVRSDPPGASIAAADGTVIGRTPLILEDKVRIRRTRHVHSTALAVLGCVADFIIGFSAIDHSGKHPESRLAGAAAIIGFGQISSCVQLGFAKLINSIGEPIQLADHTTAYFSTPDRTEDRVIPKSIDLMARWDGLASAHAMVLLPSTRAVTLRVPRSYSFDEALALWAETAPPPWPAETLYRVASAYRNLARQGVPGARARAIDLLTRYLNSHGAVEHVTEARRALQELDQPETPSR
jgi:hypothetical protein